jgi:hypothetical protein
MMFETKDVKPTEDGIALQLTQHTPEMWEKIEQNLPKLIEKLNDPSN